MRTLATMLAIGFLTTAASADVCFETSVNGNNGTVDCSTQTIFDNDYIGFSQFGVPCQVGHCGFEPRAGTNRYQWTISSSDTDPLANTGPLALGITHLYLWMNCNSGEGWQAAEFEIGITDPNLVFLAVTTLNGVLNASFGWPLLQLVVGGCPDGPFLAADILILNVGPPVSVESESWSSVKAMYR